MSSSREFDDSRWAGYPPEQSAGPRPGPWPPQEAQGRGQSHAYTPPEAAEPEYEDEDDYDDEPPPQELFEEIAALTDGIEQATSLEQLKPVYDQLVAFGREHVRNIHLEPLITQAQQRMVARGTLLKHAAESEGGRIDTATGLAVVTEPDLAAPQPDEMLSLIPSTGAGTGSRAAEMPAEIQFYDPKEAPRQQQSQGRRRPKPPEIKVTPISRDGQPQRVPQSKLLVRTLIGIGMGISMVVGTFVIMRNQQPATPPGPAVRAASPAPARPASLVLTADVPAGEVIIDGKNAGGLSQGEWALPELSPGDHVLELRAGGCEARFDFSIAAGGPPTWSKPVQATNCTVLAVAAAGRRGSVLSNEPGLPLQLDESRAGVTGSKPVALNTLFPGEHTIALGAPRVEKKVHVFTRDTATLAFFVQVSGATGTLVVSVPEDGVELILNKRTTGKTSRGGRLRIPMLKPGDYLVGASKTGFRLPAEQLVTVRRGQEAHIDFDLSPLR